MIELYTWSTPNGRKVSVMLEECGLAYELHKINIGAGDQFAPRYLAINPNGKIPSIVDPDGPDGKPIRMMESGAILIYLSAKTGRFLPKSDRGHRALHQGKGPPLRSSRPAPGGGGIPRRRVLDRRYRHLSLGRALRVAQDGLECFSQRQALVRRDRRKARGETRNGRAFLILPSPSGRG